MSNTLYRISATMLFPQGLFPGEGSEGNILAIARCGAGHPLLRGTAIAGVLRSAYLGLVKSDTSVNRWFGEPLNDTKMIGTPSRVRVADAPVSCGGEHAGVTHRTHNAINRHTGAVTKGGLFSIEHILPGSTAQLLLYVDDRGESEEGTAFVDLMLKTLGSSPCFGGNRNRGIGRMVCLANQATVHQFDLATTDGYTEWLNTRYADRKGKQVQGGQTRTLTDTANHLQLRLTLGIPRGEDLLIGSGDEMAPQRIRTGSGAEHWVIPGSTLRGVLRSWMTRLAARDGAHVSDSAMRWEAQYADTNAREYKPDFVGWAHYAKEERQSFQDNPDLVKDPILQLFGSMYRRGRIHITDSYSSRPIDLKDSQQRTHVAVDRFSGGANEGALFSNEVLIAPDITFGVTLTIDNPQEHEVKWLVGALRALHIGIISVGSSKSSGRLALKAIEAAGPQANMIATLKEEITQ